ncbi:MAG TPA: SDR family oxidoreductase [Polyangia bacterium]|jgi:hypothetical protein|nr:SDR family oxidoreductase [Polyangia bacterium]
MSSAGELAIVTGASSGIGAEFARQLAAAGTPVLAVARRGERLEALAQAARAAGHAAIHPLALDIADRKVGALVRDRARELGGASWLINNAGTTRFGRFLDVDAEALMDLVRLNCESMVGLCATVVPDLKARGAGRVINVASLAAFQPTPFQSVYGATKAFVLSFSEGLAEELRGTGVTVTALCPGPVTTEIFDVGAPGMPRKPPRHEMSPEDCVRYALGVARSGQVVAIPDVLGRITAWSTRLVPRAMVRRLSARVGLKYVGIELPPARD